MLVIVLLLSQGHPGVLLAPGKDLNDFYHYLNLGVLYASVYQNLRYFDGESGWVFQAIWYSKI